MCAAGRGWIRRVYSHDPVSAEDVVLQDLDCVKCTLTVLQSALATFKERGCTIRKACLITIVGLPHAH